MRRSRASPPVRTAKRTRRKGGTERVSISRFGGGRRTCRDVRGTQSGPSLSAIVILKTRSEDGQRPNAASCLCSRHPTSPAARVISGHPSRRHQRRPVPRALLARSGPLPPARSLCPGAGRGGRAGCPNTATPEHIPSAIPSYGAGRGFGKAAHREARRKILDFSIHAPAGFTTWGKFTHPQGRG